MTTTSLRPLLAVAATGVLLLSGCSNDEPGEEQGSTELQRFEGDGFAIDLPGEPEETTQTVPTPAGDVEIVLYTVEFDDAAVAVGVTEVPEGAPVDLDGAVEGAASNVGGEVRDSETGEFDGFETRDASITAEISGEDATGFLRVIDAEGRLVQIQQIVAGEDIAEAPSNYDEIVESLELS